uniref:Uncharacterized protein n=1 Tax=Anopheles farauti TaxID=69004 RepID=A0A182QHS7_9DIPT
MHLTAVVLLSCAVLARTAPGPCELPSLDEVGSQYLVFGQDCRQYAYGYNAGSSAKVELKRADGTVIGSYHYIDANNVTQRVNYTANDVDGFVAEGTNFPAPVPNVDADGSTEPEEPTTTVPSVDDTAPAANLWRESASGDASVDRNAFFKPIISVWLPASSYSHGKVPLQQAELSPPQKRI